MEKCKVCGSRHSKAKMHYDARDSNCAAYYWRKEYFSLFRSEYEGTKEYEREKSKFADLLEP